MIDIKLSGTVQGLPVTTDFIVTYDIKESEEGEEEVREGYVKTYVMVDGKYIVAKWVPADEFEEDTSLPSFKVKEVSREGLVTIEFSDELLVPQDPSVLKEAGPILQEVQMPKL